MAFCNSCGATLQPGAKFCAKCGTTLPVAASGAVPAAANPVPATGQGSNTVKIVLIVVAALIGLGLIGTATAGFFAWKIARRTHVETRDGKVRVESPMGTVVTSNDAGDALKNLDVEVYPGARPVNGSAATVNAGSMHTVTAQFETNDPPERVADFYKSKLPNANVTVGDEKNFSIVSTEKGRFVTVTIDAENGTTKIHIANVSGKAAAGSESSRDSD
jgi:hypothetical protein